MALTLLLSPTRAGVGLVSIAMGLVRALEAQGIKVGFFNPLSNSHHHNRETQLINPKASSDLSLSLADVDKLMSSGQRSTLLEKIAAMQAFTAKDNDVVIVKGIPEIQQIPYANQLNAEIAQAIDAKVIFVAMPDQSLAHLTEQLEISAQIFGGIQNHRILGAIINKINAPLDEEGHTRIDLAEHLSPDNIIEKNDIKKLHLFQHNNFQLFGSILWKSQLYAPRMQDIAQFLNAKILQEGHIKRRRVEHIKLCARTVNNMLHVLQPGTLIMTAGDRADIILVTAMAVLKGIKIAGLVLTGNYDINEAVMQFCAPAFEAGLTVLSVPTDSFQTATKLKNLDMSIPIDDIERIEWVRDNIANQIHIESLLPLIKSPRLTRLSPPAFRYQLIEKAQAAYKTIVLPEGNDSRTIKAAIQCAEQQIAQCILLGDPKEITEIAAHNGVQLHPSIKIIEPHTIRQNYITELVELRKNKGITEVVAEEYLQDNIMLGTMMLHRSEVDGLVSGAVHTTANTIRPALQIIKTAPDARIVSSVFFMCLPEQVLVFGDCAVNPNPNAEQLADIAIQSAKSAEMFGIDVRIAMLSYSTGASGSGSDVEKVKIATQIIRDRYPLYPVDGPLQYDAAIIEAVAQQKAPESPVAGRATVLIFPDLNTGNTTYKAVQRSADIICIGPMLQGLRKPVNDISRGALVKDIVFTIAITGIQATQ